MLYYTYVYIYIHVYIYIYIYVYIYIYMILRFSNIRGQLGVSPQPFLASRECHGSLGIYPGAVLERFYTAVCSDKSVQLPHNQAKAKNGWIPITIYYNMDSHHYGSLCSFGISYKDPELTKADEFNSPTFGCDQHDLDHGRSPCPPPSIQPTRGARCPQREHHLTQWDSAATHVMDEYLIYT